MRLLALLLLAPLGALAQEPSLFADTAVLEVTLAFDRDDVTGDRSERPPWYPARLSYADGAGGPVALDLGVRTRGFYRLHYLDCDVPPLRLNVRRREASQTLFAGQDRLKLVTHCEDGDPDAEQRVLLEHLVYRAYGLLTEASFRTRLVRVTYRDAAGRREDVTAFGFLIEDDDALAARLGGQVVDREGIHPDATDRAAVTRMSVFHYLIGNTDWTVSTLHNVRLVYRPNAVGTGASPLVAIPYDFDWAGVVDAPYATPDPQLRLRSVRQRRYLGFCRSPAEIAAAVAELRTHRDAVLSVFRDDPRLDPNRAEDAADYLAEAFDQIEEDGGERLFRDCLDHGR